jgi:hypothetical protein
MWRNLEAFVFGRTDWEYVTNTFVFPVKAGYHFIRTAAGICNGQFSGIGADAAQRCVSVENIQGMGLLITNSEFVSMHGDERIQVVVEPTCTGSVRLENCAFWGSAPMSSLALARRRLPQQLLSRDFRPLIKRHASRVSLVEADGGKLQVHGCSFRSRRQEPHVVLKKDLKHAIVSENNAVNGLDVVNEVGAQAIIANNEPVRSQRNKRPGPQTRSL